MSNSSEQEQFDQLSKPEQRAAVVFALAGKIAEAPDRIAEIESSNGDAGDKFIAFARDYFDSFYALADEVRTNHSLIQLGDTQIGILKTREDEPKAVTVIVESRGNQTTFQLPDPDLLEAGNRNWSRDSMPICRSTLDLTFDKLAPVHFDFDLVRNPDNSSYTNFANSIAFAATAIVEANTVNELDLRDE